MSWLLTAMPHESLVDTFGGMLAYIDQSSGSYVLQTLAAGFFGVVYTVKTFFGRLTGRKSKGGVDG